MNPSDNELSPTEIERAIALAAKMRDEDLDRSAKASAEKEVGDDLPYLSRAVSAVHRQHAFQQRKRVRFILAAILAIAIVVKVGLYLQGRQIAPRTSTVTAPVSAIDNTPMNLTIPPPGDSLLSPIPIPNGFKLGIHSYSPGVATMITFVNKSNHPVTLAWIDFEGKLRPQHALKPGETYNQYLDFNQPMMAIDPSGAKSLYYPSGRPTTAIITDAPAAQSREMHGYLASVPADQFPAQVARRPDGSQAQEQSKYGIDNVWITFLNMRREPVTLYELNRDGSSSRIETLQPGTLLSGAGSENERWLVMAPHEKVIGRYNTPQVSGVAVIMPE